MATIHSLAPETLIDIFELAHDPHKPSTMCAAALVCRAWRDPAQRTLFLDIVVPVVPESVNGWPIESGEATLWQSYRSNRLYTPRRVMLWDPTGRGVVQAGCCSLRWIEGVQQLFLTSGTVVYPDFTIDENLRGLEKLYVYDMDLSGPDISNLSTSPFPNWPGNLRVLYIDSAYLDKVLPAYQPSTTLVSLTLTTQGGGYFNSFDQSDLIPPSVLDLSIILSLPTEPNEDHRFSSQLISFFASARNLHRLDFEFSAYQISQDPTLSLTTSFLQSLAGSLPATISRLGITKRPDGIPSTFLIPISEVPFSHILGLLSNDHLPNLERLDFPNCKRDDLEGESAAADLLAECADRSIRIVCWEELI